MIRSLHVLILLLALLVNSTVATDLIDDFVTFPGSRDVGGCDADSSILQQAYKEAQSLVDSALKSLGSLSKQRPHYTQDAVKLSSADKQDVEEWNRQGRLVKALFAIDVDPEKGITDQGSLSRFGVVLDNFVSIQNKAFGDLGSNWLVYCTANFMTFVARYKKTPWNEVVKGNDKPNGAFVWKGLPPTHLKPQIRPLESDADGNLESQDPVKTFCGNGAQASTRRYDKSLYFCEDGLDNIDAVLGSSYAITAGQGIPETTSLVWVHELVHVHTKVDDLPEAAQVNGVIKRQGKAYGFGVIASLASLVPADAVNTADSYALYAVASSLTGWDFANANNVGKAVKMPFP